MIEEAPIKDAYLELASFIPVSEERRQVSATSGRRRFHLNNGCDTNIHSCPPSLLLPFPLSLATYISLLPSPFPSEVFFFKAFTV